MNISAPDYWNHFEIVKIFSSLQQDAPEIFIPNRQLHSVYGAPSGFIWNGGREIWSPINFHQAFNQVQELKKEGLHIKHVCSNMFIQEQDLKNKACNFWLKENEDSGDSVIVYSDLLAEYIRQNYPKYTIIYSTSRGKMTADKYNKLTVNNETVLYYSDNHNEDLMRHLIRPEKIEIIAGEPCVDNCQYRKLHGEHVSLKQLGIFPFDKDPNFICPHSRENINFFNSLEINKLSAVSNEWVDYLETTYGFQTLKISGRTDTDYTLIEKLLYYLIKPEYISNIRLEIYNNYY